MTYNKFSDVDSQNFYYIILLMKNLEKLNIIMNDTSYDNNSFEFCNLINLVKNLK